MSIKPQYATHRYTSELCKLQSQSIVECRLQSGEIASVLTVYARAVPEEITPVDGEVKYSGKVYLTVVYRDLDGRVCRVERGAEFFHKAQDERVTPACFAKAVYRADGVKTRREGSGFYVSVVVNADITVYGTTQLERLVDGEGLVVKKGRIEVVKTLCVSGETEEEDAFETDGVTDVLLHVETANVAQAYVSGGKATLIGEVLLTLCTLKNEEICSYERQIPFTVELPVDEWVEKMPVHAKTDVKSALLTVTTDEEKGRSRISVSLVLYSECLLYLKEEAEGVEDAYSTECELDVKRVKDGGRCLTNVLRFTERIGGTASLSLSTDGEISLQSVVNPRVELTCKRTGESWEAEGYVEAEAIFKTEGGVSPSKITLPFVFPVQAEEKDVEAEAVLCGLSVRRVGDKFEADGTLKVTVRGYSQIEREYVASVAEGSKYENAQSAISIYLPKEGDGLWEIAKKLRCRPEEVEKSNPELKFPVGRGERLFVYRQLK